MGTTAQRNPDQFSLFSLLVVVTLAGVLFGYSRFRPEFGLRFLLIYGFAALVFAGTLLIGTLYRKFRPASKRKKRGRPDATRSTSSNER